MTFTSIARNTASALRCLAAVMAAVPSPTTTTSSSRIRPSMALARTHWSVAMPARTTRPIPSWPSSTSSGVL